jgi:hypothetical protein
MKKSVKKDAPIIAYKGFDKDFRCRGFQYEVGKTYTHKGDVVPCESGFHACEDPLDVLSYYDITSSRFAIVEQSGKIARHSEDSKVASAKITITAELKLPEFIRAAIDAVWKACTKDKDASSGDYAKNASSGNYATNASSGNGATNASSGDGATNASSGNYAKNASSGYGAKNASSGDGATNASSGDYAKNASSGNGAKNEATGKNSVIACAGFDSMAKAAESGCFCLTWFDGTRPRMVACHVGEDGIKADVWYRLVDGKPVEVTP